MAKTATKSFKGVVLDDATGKRLVTMGGAAAVVGLAGAGILGAMENDHLTRFLHGYMIAYCYFLSIALGALFFTILQFLVRAGWSVVVRRIAEAMASTAVVMAVLFLPILIPTLMGNHALFEWLDPELAASDHLIHHKAPYLNLGFFLVRCVFYFGFWIFAARALMKNSVKQDETGDAALTTKNERLSAPFMFLFAISVTFAAIDFIMSLEPHWFSTIFGVYFFGASQVAFLSTIILLCLWLQRRDLLPGVNVEHYHDLGKLLFGFNFFWGYIAFSQFMLIWYANIPEETEWYLKRQDGGWVAVALILLFAHFFIPFVGLISRHAKRNLNVLAFWCVWLLVVHYADLLYLIGPAAGGHGAEGHPHVTVGLMEILSFIGVGGGFLAFFGHSLRGKRTVPVRDPRLHESLGFHNV